jgi:hypothetical protein
MKHYYLITGLDLITGKVFTPFPALFESKEEADKFIELSSSKTLAYAKSVVYLGKYVKKSSRKPSVGLTV